MAILTENPLDAYPCGRRHNGWHAATMAFLVMMSVFLAFRAANEDRWSDWGFGDAQTMLSLRHWQENGWLKNYLLFTPQGYAKVIDVLEEPELRHHAHGIAPGTSPRVGPRLRYTHYPAGYLLPYAAMFKAGLDTLPAVRMLSLLLSIGALAVMYRVFALISSPRVAFVAVLFYGLSPAFLGYADSLANQPIDDLLRFAFMLAVVRASQVADSTVRRRWLAAAWLMAFTLSLTSFDSVFFLYVWLVGWDWIAGRGVRWRNYLLFAAAPVLAHGLQLVQNAWYLGWAGAIADITDVFLYKNGADQAFNAGAGRLEVIMSSLGIVFNGVLTPGWLLLLPALLYTGFYRYLRSEAQEGGYPGMRVLIVLFFAGLAYVVVLPQAAGMPYEARQMVPVVSLLIGGFAWSIPTVSGWIWRAAGTGRDLLSRRLLAGSYLAASLVAALYMGAIFFSASRLPMHDLKKNGIEMEFARQLTLLPTRYEPVYFDLGGFLSYWDLNYVPGYPQIFPMTEYYAGGRPILCFQDPVKLADDLKVMLRKGRAVFSPVLVALDPTQIERAVAILRRDGILIDTPGDALTNMGRYALDLTSVIRWDNGK